MVTKFDAVIVGARCAGAATALLLARAGARVLVVDKGVYGSDTLSTHALMRGGVLQLHRWGVLPAIVAAGTPPVRATTFSYAEHDVTVAIEPRHGVNALYAPRRALLDRLLVDAAMESGAEFGYSVRVDDVRMDERGRVRGIAAGRLGLVEADIVIGADGLHSTVARRVGAAAILEGQHAAGVLYTYWEGLEAEEFYWGFRNEAGVGVIPTNDGACCVFVAVPSQRFRDEVRGDALAAYRRFIRNAIPELDARFAAARRVEQIRGFGGHRGCIRNSSGPGWALVGDAAYFKDPLTAHGITDALRDAELLARAIMCGTADALLKCDATRLDLSRTLFELTDDIVSFARTDAELQSLHRALSAEMSREVRAIAALEPLSGTTPVAPVVPV
jgi:flavin-dependent dehydrogenase